MSLRDPMTSLTPEQHAERARAWEQALADRSLPPFVTERLQQAATGRQPWVATMTPAELLLARSHGVRPIATVSGTCWFHFGFNWTTGHKTGWQTALDRLRAEARACGANAVVDTRLRTLKRPQDESMDFTLFGTAVRIDGLPPSQEPIAATVPALAFVRLLECGIVPVGLAVGAHHEWFNDRSGRVSRNGLNGPLKGMSNLWARTLHKAHDKLRKDAVDQGNGVLGRFHLSEIDREVDDKTRRYLARHLVIGTVIDAPAGSSVPHDVDPVLDMRGGGLQRLDHRLDEIEGEIAL
jgi:hypothetical protein